MYKKPSCNFRNFYHMLVMASFIYLSTLGQISHDQDATTKFRNISLRVSFT